MNYKLYLFSTLSLYVAELFLSIIVNDIGLIFEFISAIAISALAFIFPGVFYLLSLKRYGSSFDKIQGKWMKVRAYIFIVLGVFAFFFQMTANILEIA